MEIRFFHKLNLFRKCFETCLKIDYSYLESASINPHVWDFLAEKNEFRYLSFFEKCKAIVSSICLGKFL